MLFLYDFWNTYEQQRFENHSPTEKIGSVPKDHYKKSTYTHLATVKSPYTANRFFLTAATTISFLLKASPQSFYLIDITITMSPTVSQDNYDFPNEIPFEEENDLFNAFLKELPQHEQSAAVLRLEYIREYIRRNPEFCLDSIALNESYFHYYRNRDKILVTTALSEDKFHAHQILQEQIEKLKLKPQPTFEFIVYLCFYLEAWSHSRTERCGSRTERILECINAHPKDDTSMTVKVGRRNFTFNNRLFIAALLSIGIESNSMANNLLEWDNKVAKRATDYRLIKTLLDYLPIHAAGKRGIYTQAERNFALSVLHFCGRLWGNEKEVCLHNNATFDKLMRDFSTMPNDFIGNLFI